MNQLNPCKASCAQGIHLSNVERGERISVIFNVPMHAWTYFVYSLKSEFKSLKWNQPKYLSIWEISCGQFERVKFSNYLEGQNDHQLLVQYFLNIIENYCSLRCISDSLCLHRTFYWWIILTSTRKLKTNPILTIRYIL